MHKIEKSAFSRLIGLWETKGVILTDNKNPKLEGTDSYEFILDGNYMLHKANVKMGNVNSETFEIIELDNSYKQGKMHYYNSKGEKGVMTAHINQNAFTITGDHLKFEGILDQADTLLLGKWYVQTENDKWIEYIDLRLTKLSV